MRLASMDTVVQGAANTLADNFKVLYAE